MEAYCNYQERCHKDVERKLFDMKIVKTAKEVIILHLIEHGFLNEERFSKSFARGKFRIKKWGKLRIIRELKYRDISAYNINIALKEINEAEYYKTFNELAEKRLLQIKETNIYKKKKKLFDYLMYRGWETNMIYNKIAELKSEKS